MVRSRNEFCLICGDPKKMDCPGCKTVCYCSYYCKKLHRKAGHKSACHHRRRFSVSVLKSLTAVLLPTLPRPPPPPLPAAYSYTDFVTLFNGGYKKPTLALNYQPRGLVNRRTNSCFLHVTLQCLLFTRPLFAYLTSHRSHRAHCNSLSWCFLCEFESHVGRSILNYYPFSPVDIFTGLRHIGGDFCPGQQGDAHEFMKFAIDAMHSACLQESSSPNHLIHYTFAGQLRSEVRCCSCGQTSCRYEKIMDLAVEINNSDNDEDDNDDCFENETLEKCLEKFTEKEVLDGENKYQCEVCDDYVRAEKRMTIGHAPNVLIIALKRFDGEGFGKLNKRVEFPLKLDMSKYMHITNRSNVSDMYKLYGVVVHVEEEEGLGHYICYTKDFRGNWFMMDDAKVMNVDVKSVQSQQAYMLMYRRARAHPHPLIIDPEPEPEPAPIGPQPLPHPPVIATQIGPQLQTEPAVIDAQIEPQPLPKVEGM